MRHHNETALLHRTFEDVTLFEEWDRRYYYKEAMNFYTMSLEFVIKSLRLSSGDLVLDAGCGPGLHAMQFARKGIFCKAVDFSSAVLAEAKRRIKGAALNPMVTFEKLDLTHLSYKDNSIPSVFCWGVLMHIPDIKAAVAEMARVLTPGGRLAISMTNPCSFEALAYKTVRRLRHAWNWKTTISPWVQSSAGTIYVEGMRPIHLAQILAENRIRVVNIRAGQFIEHRSNHANLRRLLATWNQLWFSVIRSPLLASGYIVIGEKLAPSSESDREVRG